MSGGGDALFSCTVNEIGPAADGRETANPVIYINLTGGSFVNQVVSTLRRIAKLRSCRSASPPCPQTDKSKWPSTLRTFHTRASHACIYWDRSSAARRNWCLIKVSAKCRPAEKTSVLSTSAPSQRSFSVTVNGSGSIQFYLLSGWGGQSFNGWQLDHFTVDLDPGTFTRTYDVAGTTLLIQMTPSDKDNQAIIGIFGN